MRLALPTTPGAWVTVDAQRIRIADAESDLTALTAAIVAWNLTDDADQPLPITPEVVGKLTLADATFILGKLRVDPPRRLLQDLILAVNDEKEENTHPVPLAYTYFQYRHIMGISFPELLATPLYIVKQDIAFLNIQHNRRNHG